MKNTEEW